MKILNIHFNPVLKFINLSTSMWRDRWCPIWCGNTYISILSSLTFLIEVLWCRSKMNEVWFSVLRTWWFRGSEVPHLAGSPSGSGYQLRRQHRLETSLFVRHNLEIALDCTTGDDTVIFNTKCFESWWFLPWLCLKSCSFRIG